MTIQERIRNCLILENMKENKKAAERLGLRDISRIEKRKIRIVEGNLSMK
jgi:hypothetical protein